MPIPGMVQRAHGTTTTNTRPPTPHPCHDANDFHTHEHYGISCQFYLSNGELSAYGLACGYVQRRTLVPDFTVELFREHAHYHVRTSTYVYGASAAHNRIWEVFDTLTPARRRYHELIREYMP